MILDPVTTFLLILVIGIVVGLVFDRLAGPGWLTRQIAGGTRLMFTSALVGVAGAFIGYHLTLILGLGRGYGALIGAVVGAAVVLWVWRMIK
jgi:uncharacterized membrane protein YeaQ/YmgE (transglycosylase-associated protein family)